MEQNDHECFVEALYDEHDLKRVAIMLSLVEHDKVPWAVMTFGDMREAGLSVSESITIVLEELYCET